MKLGKFLGLVIFLSLISEPKGHAQQSADASGGWDRSVA